MHDNASVCAYLFIVCEYLLIYIICLSHTMKAKERDRYTSVILIDLTREVGI